MTFDEVADYDYWSVFRLCVNDLKISPSEAWGLDVIEVHYLLNSEENKKDDLSVMLNFERVQNGASTQWLHNH